MPSVQAVRRKSAQYYARVRGSSVAQKVYRRSAQRARCCHMFTLSEGGEMARAKVMLMRRVVWRARSEESAARSGH